MIKNIIHFLHRINKLFCTFFKDSNKIVLITKGGTIGLFTEEDFMELDLLCLKESRIIDIDMKKIDVASEDELREFLN